MAIVQLNIQKINCKYDLKNKKVLVSNGRSLVIKTNNSYYIYPLRKNTFKFYFR